MRIYLQALDDGTVVAVTPAAPGTTQVFGPLQAGQGVSVERGPLANAPSVTVTLDGSDPVPLDGSYCFQVMSSDEARSRGLIS